MLVVMFPHHLDRSQSLFYFVPQESHSQAGSTTHHFDQMFQRLQVFNRLFSNLSRLEETRVSGWVEVGRPKSSGSSITLQAQFANAWLIGLL